MYLLRLLGHFKDSYCLFILSEIFIDSWLHFCSSHRACLMWSLCISAKCEMLGYTEPVQVPGPRSQSRLDRLVEMFLSETNCIICSSWRGLTPCHFLCWLFWPHWPHSPKSLASARSAERSAESREVKGLADTLEWLALRELAWPAGASIGAQSGLQSAWQSYASTSFRPGSRPPDYDEMRWFTGEVANIDWAVQQGKTQRDGEEEG